MKSSAFNAQGSRVIIVVVQVGAVKIYVVGVVDGGAQVKRKEGVKISLRLSLPQKEKENLKFSPFFWLNSHPFFARPIICRLNLSVSASHIMIYLEKNCIILIPKSNEPRERCWSHAKWHIMQNQGVIFGILIQLPIDETMQNFINKHTVDLENVQSYKRKGKGRSCRMSS